ncbi:helix-turn-helix domain-containing protein [Halegenticoccus tardaugens]|uniref:helix-turn-helix domain-containing protein n=1 Tax=Halegenticoccus tardaugens TaxID=2071624 RepID=UPI00100A9F95|nr:helix-turn-helix domain-containing protein [Halegenticoccus tardaugens]
MSTIAEVEVPAAEFALRETLSTLPDVQFEVVRLAAHDHEQVMPYLRVSEGDLESVEPTLLDDPSVSDVELLDDLGNERLFRMNWVSDIRVILHVVLDEGATVVDMQGKDDSWQLRILFPTRDSLSATHDFCVEEGLTFTIRNIYDLKESVGSGQYGLTSEQYDALVTAAERGYFDVPRRLTMSELASELGVSQQSLSERLRRGHKALVDSALRVGKSSFGK